MDRSSTLPIPTNPSLALLVVLLAYRGRREQKRVRSVAYTTTSSKYIKHGASLTER